MIFLFLLFIPSFICHDGSGESREVKADWSETIEKLVEYQNELRSFVAQNGIQKFTAANMNKLVHVPTLAYFAKSIAKTHPKFTTPEHRAKGILVHYSPGFVTNLRVLSKDIWREKLSQITAISDWTPDRYSKYMFDVAADAIQILWATARKIGCAGEYWRDEEGEKHTVLVCKYNEVARVEQEIYEIGPKCSQCSNDLGMECERSSGLCVEISLDDYEEIYDEYNVDQLNAKFNWDEVGRDVVAVHNRLRSELVFGSFRGENASNMNELTYDTDLANVALRIIRKYKPTSNDEVYRQLGILVFHYSKFIQNRNFFIKYIWDKTIRYLNRLPNNFRPSKALSRRTNKIAGDALQIIWANATHLGCAGQFMIDENWKEMGRKKHGENTYFLCIWNEARTVGESVYEAGQACDNCARDRMRCSANGSGLCSEEYDENEDSDENIDYEEDEYDDEYID
ncbi:unnamed protein product [Caenorhabditis angaria]|uniref:SCP domain-containing protein n=1 Tax=Caenorhabditis angaria TaxID=860376 RepID=A0A9P1IL00_9PELO|nr:unnamed protein product [Caenorhabditis angaria]